MINEIEIRGVSLSIEYEYEQPRCPECGWFEISAVFAGDIDIMQIMNEQNLFEIEKAIKRW